jgi:hypothetical protein
LVRGSHRMRSHLISSMVQLPGLVSHLFTG